MNGQSSPVGYYKTLLSQIAFVMLCVLIITTIISYCCDEQMTLYTKIYGILAIIVFIYFLIGIPLYWYISKKQRVLRNYRKFRKDKISYDEFKEKFPDVRIISVVGKGSVGKTRFVNNLCQITYKNEYTQGRHAYIKKFRNKNNRGEVWGVLDGKGQHIPGQNDNAIIADILIVLIDHNTSNTDISIIGSRIEEHKSFVEILNHRITSTKEQKIGKVFFLVNKSDLWRQNSPKSITDWEQVAKDMFQNLYQELKRDIFDYLEFSNEKTDDINLIVEKIETYLEK